jgi:exodeoxyribonuclease VII large subunit
LQSSALHFLKQKSQELQTLESALPTAMQRGLQRRDERLQRAALRLGLLDPTLVLQRGYAWLTNERGETITSVVQTSPGQRVQATLADGAVDLTVVAPG